MAESAAYARRGFSGAAKQTTLASGITNAATSLDGADLSTWSACDDNGPFRGVLTDGVTEEEFEATTVSGNTISGITRGVGGTTASAWSAGVTLKHVSSVRDFDEANKLVSSILGISGLAAGDVLYFTSATALARLAKGAAYQGLQMNSGATAPTWGESIASLLTAGGDIPYASAANTPARLAKGSAYQSLNMNSGATAPSWMASLQSLLTAAGDIIYASGANTPARLAKGSDGQVLTLASGIPSWAAAASGFSYSSATTTTLQSTSSTSFTDLSTVGPAVTVTTGTTALVILTCSLSNDTSNARALMGFAVSGASTVAANDNDAISYRTSAASAEHQTSIVIPVTGLTAGSNTFTGKYRAGIAGTASFQYRRITVIPT